MTRDLHAQVRQLLMVGEPRTCDELARLARARRADVLAILVEDENAVTTETPLGASPRAVYWTLLAEAAEPSQPVQTPSGRRNSGPTHNEKVLRLLSDGAPHSHHEGYRLGVILHSRVSDLRKQGHRIEAWREGDQYLYQLVDASSGMEGEAGTPAPLEAGVPASVSDDVIPGQLTLAEAFA